MILLLLVQDVSFEERRLARVPEGAECRSFCVSNDGRSALLILKKGGKEHASVGDRMHEAFDEIRRWDFERKPIYVAKRDGWDYFVVDGVTGDAFDRVWDRWIHTRDGGRFAALASRGDHRFLLTPDGRSDAPPTAIDLVDFLADGKTPVYRSYRSVWTGKEEGPRHGEVEEVRLDPTRTRILYRARSGMKWFVVVDGKKGEEYDEVLWPEWDPTGKSVAYKARLGRIWYLVQDGVRRLEGEEISAFVFRPDGGDIACKVRRGGRSIVVAAGKEGEPFDSVEYLGYSRDGKRFAYPALQGEKWFLVVDGEKRETRGHERIYYHEFNADGSSIAYVARTEKLRRAVFVDGKAGPVFEGMEIDGLVFRTKLAYRAGSADDRYVVAGRRTHGPFRDAGYPVLNADETKAAFWMWDGRELWWKVVEVE